MIPVATNHAADVIDGNVLPVFVANVLPAGDFFQNQQADLVAGIEKVTRLRIMRRANDVAFELVAQDLGVSALRPARHCLTNPREGLMAIEAAQLDDFAIQFETVIGELGFAETKTAGVFVDDLVASQQAGRATV